MTMGMFLRGDGARLRVVPGFRDAVLNHRRSVTPRARWSDAEYDFSARTKIRRARRLLGAIRRRCGRVAGLRVLEVGCGDGVNALCLANAGARVTAIDLDLKPFRWDDRGAQARRLLGNVLARMDGPDTLNRFLARHDVRFLSMNAARMGFADASFDLVLSRSVLEHVRPLDRALAEMARVLRPGGRGFHAIDPFYWIRGCHKKALVDLPWAHARLPLDEYQRFVVQSEGRSRARKRRERLRTLNRFNLREWRSALDRPPCVVVKWTESVNPFAERMLARYPEAARTRLPHVAAADLVCGRIEAWLEKRP